MRPKEEKKVCFAETFAFEGNGNFLPRQLFYLQSPTLQRPSRFDVAPDPKKRRTRHVPDIALSVRALKI